MFWKKLSAVVLYSVALALSGAVSGQEEPEDEGPGVELDQIIVEDSALYPPGETEVQPGVPSVGTPADSGDLLRGVPGVSGARMGGHGVDPVIRGQMGNRINILLDGAYIYGGCPNRMDPPTAYAPYESYDRIIVLKGPRSVRYKGGSGGSVLFERSTPPFEEGEYARGDLAAAYADNEGRFNGSADLAVGIPAGYLRAIYNHIDADDYRDGDNDEVPSSFRSNQAAFIGGWTPEPRFRLDVSWETVNVDDALYPGAGMDSPTSDSTVFIAKMEGKDLESVFSGFKAQYYESRVEHTMDNYSLRDRTAPMPLFVDTESDTTGGRVEAEFSGNNSVWTLGFDLENSARDARRYTGPNDDDVHTLNSVMWPDVKLGQYGIFSDLETELAAGVKLGVGVRYDRVDAQADDADVDPPGGPMSPDTLYRMYYGEDSDGRQEDNFGAIIHLESHPDAESPLVFMNLSRTVRTADATERFIAANGMTPPQRWIGNPDLAPEVHHMVELGLMQSGEGWLVSVAAYYDWATDYILRDSARGQGDVLLADFASVYRNVNAELIGGEVETRWNWTDNLQSRVALAYVYALNRTDQKAIAQIPPLTANLSLDYTEEKWSAGSRLRMTAEQTRVDDKLRSGSGLDAGETPGYGVFDLYGQVNIIENVDLQLGVNNVLDHTYAEHLNKPNAFDPTEIQVNEPGRTWWVKVKAGF